MRRQKVPTETELKGPFGGGLFTREELAEIEEHEKLELGVSPWARDSVTIELEEEFRLRTALGAGWVPLLTQH